MNEFDKYKKRGDIHWQEAFSRSPFKFNAVLRARYQVASDFLGETKNKVVLDIGAGDCALSSLFAKNGAKVLAVDSSSEGLEFGRAHFKRLGLAGKFILADVYRVPLLDATADAVVLADVIEHLDRPLDALKEARRLLRPGGCLVLTTPYRLREIPAPQHVREFYPAELRSLLAAAGFTVVEIKESHPVFWHALYTSRGPFLSRPFGKYLVNMAALWLNKNPFLRDSRRRGKNDIFTQIACRAIKNGQVSGSGGE